MNGWKPLIFLHEAEIDYELVNVDFSKKEQHARGYEVEPERQILDLGSGRGARSLKRGNTVAPG